MKKFKKRNIQEVYRKVNSEAYSKSYLVALEFMFSFDSSKKTVTSILSIFMP